MMLSLPRDVSLHVSRPRATHGKGGVSRLPTESLVLGKLFVYPSGRIRLHHSEQLRDRFGGGYRHQQVNVILGTIDNQRRAVSLPDNARHIREKAAGEFGRQNGGTVLRRKNYVDQKGGEAVRHKRYAPFRGRRRSGARVPRLTPWAILFRPPGCAANTRYINVPPGCAANTRFIISEPLRRRPRGAGPSAWLRSTSSALRDCPRSPRRGRRWSRRRV